MDLTLIISDNCKACERAIISLNKFKEQLPEINISILNKSNFKNIGIQITPALLVDDELFSYGDISESNLLKKIYPNHKNRLLLISNP